MDAAIRYQGALIKALEIQIEKKRDLEVFLVQLKHNARGPCQVYPLLLLKLKKCPIDTHITPIRNTIRLGKLAPTKLIVELADRTMKHPKCIAENVLVRIDKFIFPIDFIVLDMPDDIKTPLILGRPFLYTAHAKIDGFKIKNALRVKNDKIVFKSDNLTSNIIKGVYVLGIKERMELDLEAWLMGEALILDRPQDPKIWRFSITK
ncbi:DNA/RNA polymerases superfamily protein [Tanacetum coccineum]